MEGLKVQLTCKEGIYYVLQFDSSPEVSRIMTLYPYKNGDQKYQLEKARDFAKARASSLHLPLEETLTENENTK